MATMVQNLKDELNWIRSSWSKHCSRTPTMWVNFRRTAVIITHRQQRSLIMSKVPSSNVLL